MRVDGTPSAQEPRILSPTGVRRGLMGFVLLTAAGLTALFVFTFDGDAAQVVAGLRPSFLALALVSLAFDTFMGGFRFHVFLRKMAPGTRFALSYRADLVGRFLGTITPSQSGGGPGQIFVLYKGGVRLPVILSVLMVNLVASMLFLVAAGAGALWVFRERLPEGVVPHLARWGFAAFALILGVLLLTIVAPGFVLRPFQAASNRFGDDAGRVGRGVRRLSRALGDSADLYRSSCLDCVRRWPSLPVLSVILTAVMYLNKFTLAWLIVRGLGVDAPYLTTVAVQAVLNFVLYLAPTPGGSGIAEVSAGALMALVMPVALVAPFTLVWRFLLGFAPAAAGAVALALTLSPSRAPGEIRFASALAVSPASPPGGTD